VDAECVCVGEGGGDLFHLDIEVADVLFKSRRRRRQRHVIKRSFAARVGSKLKEEDRGL
jgi:hypothetical protein